MDWHGVDPHEWAPAVGLTLLFSTACAETPSPGACSNTDAPVLTLANRQVDAPVLRDGDEVDVFPPPQGGVFTELDVGLLGVAPEDLQRLHVTIDSVGSLGRLASASYLEGELLLWCSEDGVLQVEDLPVAFDDAFGLRDLHGESAALEGRAETAAGEVSTRYEVILWWVDY